MDLRPENEEIANVYFLTRRQVVTAEEGRVTDINILAVKAVMDIYQVKDQEKCLLRVVALFRHFMGDR